MTRIRTLLVDDERLARRGLELGLAAAPDVEIVGECENGREAIEQIAALAPDLMFLDIQMPGLSGFDVLARLPQDSMPVVVFVTAFDRYAIDAFEARALDYLLKPVDPVRLASAIERLEHRAETESPPPRLAPEDKVFVREGERCWFVEVRSIRLMESEGNYTRVHFGDAQPQLFRSLNAMEARLDPRAFFRANRRQIINLSWIDRIEPWFSGGLLVHLKGGLKVELSRRQAQSFREKMSL